MVDLRAVNAKLNDRAERIVMVVTMVSRTRARKLLKEARGEAKTAILMHSAGLSYTGARRRLAARGGSLRSALERSR
jgi:N-acetylmuramic acid 6-phosphate etherase